MLQMKQLPLLREAPILGSLPHLQHDRAGFLMDIARLGPVARCNFGPLPIVAFNTAEYVQSLLVEKEASIWKGKFMHKAFPGDGLFISEGQLHRKQRKTISPSFTPRMIGNYADTMAQEGEQLVQRWQDGQEVDLSAAMSNTATIIVGKALFSEDITDEANGLYKPLKTVFDHCAYMMAHPFAPPANWPTPRNLEKDRAWAVIRNRVKVMMQERRANPDVERIDFLSRLMAARDEQGQPMSDIQIEDEAVTIFTGGEETVAASLAWAWYLLCQHPDIYQQVQHEVDTVLQGRTPTLADLARLPYCLQVFKETLRLYPPPPAIPREVREDIEVTSDLGSEPVFLKKGTSLVINVQAMHRYREYYPEPDTFEPERFTPEREKQLPRNAFLPFGAGPRICLGNHFALLEGQLLIATLAQRVRFELLADQDITLSSETLSTKSKQNIRVKVYCR